MLAVDFGPGGKLSLVLGFESLLFVPPGAATVEIVSDVRGADDRHTLSPQRFSYWKGKYSTNFLNSIAELRHAEAEYQVLQKKLARGNVQYGRPELAKGILDVLYKGDTEGIQRRYRGSEERQYLECKPPTSDPRQGCEIFLTHPVITFLEEKSLPEIIGA